MARGCNSLTSAMIPYLKLIIISILALAAMQGASAAFRVEHLTKADGLAGTIVSDLMRDRDGYIWVGTWEGLCRYDGYSFRTFNKRGGSAINNFHNRINSIYQDSCGNIWTQLYNDRIFRLNRLTETFDDLGAVDSRLGESRPGKPYFSADGRVWIPVDGVGVFEITTDPRSNAMSSKFHPLENVDIGCIYRDSRGTVWLASEGDLKILDSPVLAMQCMAEGETPLIAAETGGEVVWGTKSGHILVFDYNKHRLSKLSYVCREPVTSLAASGGTVYIGTRGGSVVQLDVKTLGSKTAAKVTGPVHNLQADSRGMLWIMGGAPGTALYNPADGTLKTFTQTVRTHDNDSQAGIMECGGEVWVAMHKGGFGRYDHAAGTIVSPDGEGSGNTLSSNVIRHMLVSGPGEVWVATERRGLDRITEIAGKTGEVALPAANGMAHGGAKAFLTARDSTLWVGTKGGCLMHYGRDGELMHVMSQGSDGQPLGKVYAIVEDRDGTLWIATRETGLLAVRGADTARPSIKRYRAGRSGACGLSSNDVQDLILDRGGRLWAATYGGGVEIGIPDSDGITFISAGNGSLEYPVRQCGKMRQLAEDRDGRIWGATTEGLVCMDFDPGTKTLNTTVYRHDDGNPASVPANDILCVHADPSGQIWLGTLGGGLAHHLGGGRFEHFQVSDGLPSDYVQGLASDSNGNIWLGTEQNIVSYNKLARTFSVLGEGDGIGTAMLVERGTGTGHDGRLLFGTQDSFYVVDAAALNSRPTRGFMLRVTDVAVSDPGPHRGERRMKPCVYGGGTLRLDPDSEIEVTVASLNYLQQGRTAYQWSLDNGPETVWQTMPGRKVTLSHLAPGLHTLAVRAFMAGDPGNADYVEVHIDVPLKPWRTWWFWVVPAVLAAAYALYKLRHRPAKRTEAEPAAPLTGKTLSITPEAIVVEKEEDEEFMKNLMAWMEKNYADPNMKVEAMAAASGLGRTTFYNKLKSLVNASPVDFVIDFRMKKARMMMRDTRKTISEIAYLTGYADPHYFTRAYKSRYGETPTQYRNRHKEPPPKEPQPEAATAENGGDGN